MLGSKLKTYSGIKLHAVINHIHQQIILYGAPKYVDTTRFEHQHAADGVAAAVMTSRRPSTLSGELLITVFYTFVLVYMLVYSIVYIFTPGIDQKINEAKGVLM
jgi:hypothetical protein